LNGASSLFQHHTLEIVGDWNQIQISLSSRYWQTKKDFYTLLVDVAICLTSLPAHTMSNDTTNLRPAIPGHFLVGESLVVVSKIRETEEKPPKNYVRHLKLVN